MQLVGRTLLAAGQVLQIQIAAADVESVGGKSVPGDRSLGPWVPVTARESDVDAGWDGIGQSMSSQRRDQASRLWCRGVQLLARDAESNRVGTPVRR